MTQFALYKNANKASQKNYPYLLDIQSDLLSELSTTVVIPLMPARLAVNHAITKLNPAVKVKSEKYCVMTQNVAGIDRSVLGTKAGDLSKYRAEIIGAIDFVISGI